MTCLEEGRDEGGGKPGDLTLLWCAGESTLREGGPTDEVLARGGAPEALSLRGGGGNGVLETTGDGRGNDDACVGGVIADPQPEACRLVLTGSIGGSYAFEVFDLNDSAVTLGGAGTGGTGGLG